MNDAAPAIHERSRVLPLLLVCCVAGAAIATTIACQRPLPAGNEGALAAGPAKPSSERHSAAPPQAVRLSILSLNDFHGQIDPLALKTNETPRRLFRVGGAEALAATIAALRRENPAGTLLLDGGDAFHGTLLSNHFEGDPVLELYALLRVDAAVVGNHEFDFGPVGPTSIAGEKDDPRGTLKGWARRAHYSLLAANIRDPAGPWPKVTPSTIIVRQGVRVGLVGLTSNETPSTTHLENVKDLRFERLTTAAQREVSTLRRRRADAIIALAHLGGDCRGPADDDCRGELFDLLRELPRGTFDAVIAGHSHSCIWRRFNGVLVSESCSQGIAVGRLELLVRPGGGVDHRSSRVLAPVPVCHEVFADTGDCEGLQRRGTPRAALHRSPAISREPRSAAAARRLVRRFRQRIAHMENRVLVHLRRPLRHRRHGWSELGFLFAEIMRRAANADVGLINAGGIRADLPAGRVTFADLYATHPFDNALTVVTLTGAQLHALLVASLNHLDAGVLQPAGLRLRIRCGRIKKLLAVARSDGQPLRSAQRYRVALTDFMLAGDGLGAVLGHLPSEQKRVYPERLARELIAAHLAREGIGIISAVRASPTPPVTMEGACDSPSQNPPLRPLCR